MCKAKSQSGESHLSRVSGSSEDLSLSIFLSSCHSTLHQTRFTVQMNTISTYDTDCLDFQVLWPEQSAY